MESDINVNKIRAIAQNWSLEGDNYLLEWMKEISENLERRSNATTSSLQQLSTDLTRTHIALDNAANSLNALQYSQFVESRCHNDDETLANPANVPTQALNESKTTTKTSKEIIQTFLRNNLNMLENCHEKYVIDFEEDSDEEEPINKYIYQPKNPYNERLLPHIYGSKLWHDTPHIGLCDNVNNYSGDEQSDKFSESSNTPEEENDELFESSTNLSAWASSTSITNDKPVAVQHSATPPSRKPSLLGQDPVLGVLGAAHQIAAAATPDRRTDLFSALDDTPPGTSTSSTGTVSGSSSLSSHSLQQSVASNNNNQPKTPAPRGVAVLPTMPPSPHANVAIDHMQRPLFIDEDPPPMTPTPLVATKRRPINIFDDDDYDSFLSEITEKAQAKQTDCKKGSDVAPRTSSQENPGGFTAPKESQPIQISPPKPKPARINLFESPEASPTDESGDLFAPTTAAATKPAAAAKASAAAAPSTVAATATRQSVPTRMPRTSLFDDDDDDDDFLNVFKTRNRATPSLTTSRLFFDDEESGKTAAKEPETSEVKDAATTSSNLFKESKTPEVSVIKPTTKKFTSNLFDDDENEEDDLFGFSASKKVPPPTERKQYEEVPSRSHTLRQEQPKEDKQRVEEQQPKKEQHVEQQQKAEQEQQQQKAEHERQQQKAEQERKVKQEQQRQEEQKQKKLEQERQVVEQQQKEEQMKKHNEQQQPIVEVEKEEPPPMEEPEPKEVLPARMKPPNKLSSILFDDEDTEDSLFAVKPPSPMKPPLGKDVAEPPRQPPEEIKQEPPIQPKKDQSQAEHGETTPRLSVSPQKQKTFKVPHVPPSHNFTNIFMDEPPDDDDFFQTLGASTLSASKMTLDIDHDFDEPPLPQPTPKTTENGSKNASEPKPATYSGFQLFSDIPPDDDGSDYRKVPAPVPARPVVFYDDFDETLAAMRTKNEAAEKQQTASLFGDESPPDEPSIVLEEKQKEKPEVQVEPTKDETDRVVRADSLDSSPQEPAKEPAAQANVQRPRAKLKMPNININVQALMPNAGGKPQYQRPSAEPTGDKKAEVVETPTTSSPSFEESQKIEEKRDETNPNVLSNVNKSRVRAPAKRRPSSRKARQESYRKSMIAEEEESKQFDSLRDVKANEPATESVKSYDRTTTKEDPFRREEIIKEAPRREETKKESVPRLEEVKNQAPPKREEIKKEAAPETEETEKETPPKREEAKKEPPPKLEESKTIEALQPNNESKIPTSAEAPKVAKKNMLQAFLEDANDEDDDDFLFNISQKSSKSGGGGSTAKQTETNQATAKQAFDQPPATRDETTTTKEKETAPVRSQRNLEEASLFEEPAAGLSDTRKTESTQKPQLFESRSLFDEPPEDFGFDSILPSTKAKTEEKPSQPPKATLGSADFLFDDAPPEDTFFSSLRREEPKAAAVREANIPTTKASTSPPETAETKSQAEPVMEVAETGKQIEPVKEKTEEGGNPLAGAEMLKSKEPMRESGQTAKKSGQTGKASESTSTKVRDPSEPVKPPSTSLFGDSDDDDGDDLFDSMETVRKSASRAVAPPLTTTSPAAGPVKATAAKPLPSKSLFPSDDSDDDGARDLFRGAPAKPLAVTPHRRTDAAPLFGDDDSNGSDNDQLFAAPRKLESKAVRRNTPAAPLFSDDDDDDDLFGAKSTAAKVMKAKTTPAGGVTSPLVATKVQPTATPLSTSRNVSDNPLADLLDP